MKVRFFLHAAEVSAAEAELHFQNWALDAAQEDNTLLLKATGNDRSALGASRVFNWCVTQTGADGLTMRLAIDMCVRASGIWVCRDGAYYG